MSMERDRNFILRWVDGGSPDAPPHEAVLLNGRPSSGRGRLELNEFVCLYAFGPALRIYTRSGQVAKDRERQLRQAVLDMQLPAGIPRSYDLERADKVWRIYAEISAGRGMPMGMFAVGHFTSGSHTSGSAGRVAEVLWMASGLPPAGVAKWLRSAVTG